MVYPVSFIYITVLEYITCYITAISLQYAIILPLYRILLLYYILPFSVTTKGIILRAISRLFAAVISHYKLLASNLYCIFL